MPDVRLQAVEGEDDPILPGQLPAQVNRVAELGGQQLVVAVEQVDHAALGNPDTAPAQDRVDLRD
ncbi:hypothetical protein QO001_005679 [Methylobacterium brachiatum]|uniref:Uncharacterized protein n=1 Tax=Methylobacterium brachiatum TaxID=269660 RepID=A0AAJ1TT68_9HYPH|nr:hypothetical protein [Methylobacterium brachiatum]